MPAGHMVGMGAADLEAADIAGAAAHDVHDSSEPDLLQDPADHGQGGYGSDSDGGEDGRHLLLLWDARRPPCSDSEMYPAAGPAL